MLALLLALAAPAAADPAPPVWAGVWRGSVGTLPVRACLTQRYDGQAVGLYYYESRLRPILLEQQGHSRLWLEGPETRQAGARPQWRFDTVARAELGGSWTAGPRRLPFRLARVAHDADEEPCASLAFNAPRLRPLQVTRKRASLDGVPYVQISFDPGPALRDEVKLESFALEGDDPATRRINARLGKPFPLQPAGSEWWGCVASGLASAGMGGDYEASIKPTLVTRRWLAAASTTAYYCGGAHPDGGTTPLTFDRTTGAEVDLKGWLNAAALEPRPDIDKAAYAMRPALRRLAMAQDNGMDAECRAPVAEAEFWDVGLTRAGLSFTPEMPHALAACADPMTVPWAAMGPYLSAAGRAGRAGLAER